jgi:methionyl-tRNA formyltransferase
MSDRGACRAVVFAYHDVGVRCLKVLLSGKVEIPLVVTVPDDPNETRWFASVAETAREYRLPLLMPQDAADAELAQRIARLEPDFLFSFYYRSMLGAPLLRAARAGALNMHGSLLPKYRGRAPVNWAILNGERQTGATLHYMVERADAGDIVDQLAVPILDDDDAREVFGKVTAAAEIVLARSLPGLIAGTAPRRPQVIEPGQYFGRRRPEDGRIDWSHPAARIHDLVRAVAPPFPGAYTEVDGRRWWLHRTRLEPRIIAPSERARLFGAQGECYAACRDGGVLRILAAATQEGPIDLARMSRELEAHPATLD